MTGKILKICGLALGLAAPNAMLAQGCVDDVDTLVSLVENGMQHQAERIVDYTALISPRDLTNSKGVRLTSFAAILQQDRANLHKSGVADGAGDFRDGFDDYFTTPKRRSQLAGAQFYTACYMSTGQAKALKSAILNGKVQGVIWVVAFQRPDGGLGVYLSEVN